jgi:hypothetical protein
MSIAQAGTARLIAATGHTAAQAPQPVQVAASSTGAGTAPGAGRRRMARTSQRSAHAEHTTRFSARQPAPIEAFGSES